MLTIYPHCLNLLSSALGLAGLIAPREPRKLITRGGKRRRYRYPSYRFGKIMEGEAALEFRSHQLFDMSYGVRDAKAQPVVLRIPDEEDERGYFEYTPDSAAVIQPTTETAMEPVLVECKPLELSLEPETVRKHGLISQVLARIEVRFVVLTERELPESLDANLNDMFCYARYRRSPTDRKDLERKVRGERFETFGELVAKIGKPDACHTLASGWWYFNHNKPLTDESRLSLFPRLEWDAARPLYPRSFGGLV